jgi:hypothetical protein
MSLSNIEKKCIYCGEIYKGSGKKYCSNQCQNDDLRMNRVKGWLNGDHSGMRGKTSTARWIKWYLIKERGEKCELCDWNERNPFTNNIPIELEHIDGDFTNNHIDNLKLICPNCHSLTSTYKSLNNGKGRPRQ